MGVGEWWHKTAVYFGIADDEDEYDEDETLAPHEELERSYQERPNVRKLNTGRSRNDYDDIFADEPRRRTSSSASSQPPDVLPGRTRPILALELLLGLEAVLVPLLVLGDAEVDERAVPDVGESHDAGMVSQVPDFSCGRRRANACDSLLRHPRGRDAG